MGIGLYYEDFVEELVIMVGLGFVGVWGCGIVV